MGGISKGWRNLNVCSDWEGMSFIYNSPVRGVYDLYSISQLQFFVFHHPSAPEIDMSELENLFSASVPNSDQGTTGGKSRRLGAPISDIVQLVRV